MNIKVKLNPDEPTDLTGGEHAICNLEISVDPSLSERTQRGLIIHSVIENYNRGLAHSKVEELCDMIQDGLDQLEPLIGE